MRADSGSSCSAKKGSSRLSRLPKRKQFALRSMLQPHLHFSVCQMPAAVCKL